MSTLHFATHMPEKWSKEECEKALNEHFNIVPFHTDDPATRQAGRLVRVTVDVTDEVYTPEQALAIQAAAKSKVA